LHARRIRVILLLRPQRLTVIGPDMLWRHIRCITAVWLRRIWDLIGILMATITNSVLLLMLDCGIRHCILLDGRLGLKLRVVSMKS